MPVIYTDTNDDGQTIRIHDDAAIDVVPSGCEERPVTVDLPHTDRPEVALGLVHAILAASGLDVDYEITLKADAEAGTEQELADGRALVAFPAHA